MPTCTDQADLTAITNVIRVGNGRPILLRLASNLDVDGDRHLSTSFSSARICVRRLASIVGRRC